MSSLYVETGSRPVEIVHHLAGTRSTSKAPEKLSMMLNLALLPDRENMMHLPFEQFINFVLS